MFRPPMCATLCRLLSLLLFAGIASQATADHVPLDAKLTMDGPAFAAPGSQITYVLRLSGLFPHASYAVTDTLPPNAHFVSAGAPNWNCIQQSGKVTCGTSDSDLSAFLNIVIDAPSSMQTIANTATVQSLSTFDPNPDNNTATVQTVLYDAGVCAARHIEAMAPADRAILTSGHVTLQWSPVAGAARYDVWAGDGSSVAKLLDTTGDTQLTHDFTSIEVFWYVEAAMPDCPPVDTAAQRFTLRVTPQQRRRAVAHS